MNYLSISKLQRLHRWSLGMDKCFHPTFFWACDYWSMLGLKLDHVSKRGHWDNWCLKFDLTTVIASEKQLRTTGITNISNVVIQLTREQTKHMIQAIFFFIWFFFASHNARKAIWQNEYLQATFRNNKYQKYIASELIKTKGWSVFVSVIN